MAKMLYTPKSYGDCKVLLNRKNRDELKLGNNTWVRRGRCGDYYAIVLHNTEIVQFHEDGRIVLSNGGYETRTTKERINEFIPRGYVSQKNYNWYYEVPVDGDWKKYQFQSGMEI